MSYGLQVVFVEDTSRWAQYSTLPQIFTSEDFPLKQRPTEDVDFWGSVWVPDVLGPFYFDWVSAVR